MAFTTNQEIVAEYYIAALGRSPEMAGLDYWVGRLEGTTGTQLTAAQIRNFFLDTNIPEVAARFPTLDATTLVSSVYLNVFGRAADAGGQAYWEGRLDGTTGTLLTMPELVSTMLAVAQDPALSNTVDAAYIASLITAAEVSYDAEVAAAALVTAIQLTSATDSLVGTAGNDTWNATAGELVAADTILDSTSTDADVLYVETTAAIGAARIQNVETINVNGTYVTTGMDLANTSGTTNLNLTTGILGGTATVTNASSINALNVDAGTNVSTLNVTATASGTRDTVYVDAGSATTVTVAGNTGGDTFDVTVGAGASVVMNGGAGVADTYTLHTTGATATIGATSDASTEYLTIDNTTVATVVTTKGPAVADFVSGTNTYGVTLTGSKSITLVDDATVANGDIWDDKQITDSTTAGTTTLKFTGAQGGAALDLEAAVVDVVQLAHATNVITNAITVNTGTTVNITGGGSVLLNADDKASTGAVTNTLMVNLSNAVTEIATDVGVQTLLISATPDAALDTDTDANGTAETDITLTTLTLDAATTTVVVQGSADLKITTLANNAASVLSASNMTGNLTIGATSATGTYVLGSGTNSVTLGNFASTVHGGTGVDTITGDAAADTINGGAGNDIIAGGITGLNTIDAGAGNDTITVTGTATDTITLGTGSDTVKGAVNLNYTVTDISTTEDTLVITGTATTAANLTNVIPVTGAYKISNSGGVADFTLTGSTATDVSAFVQLGTATAIFTAAAGLAVTAGAKNDVIAVNGANTIATGAGTDAVIVASAQTTATVSDFTVGSDVIILAGAAASGASVNLASVTPVTGKYTVDANHAITLKSGGTALTATDLTAMVKLGASGAEFTMDNTANAAAISVTSSSFDDYVALGVIGTVANSTTFKFIDNGGVDYVSGIVHNNVLSGVSFTNMTGITGTGTDIAANATKISDAQDGAVYVFASAADGTGTEAITTFDYTGATNVANGVTQASVLADVAAFLSAGLGTTTGEKYVVVINESGATDANEAYAYSVNGNTAGITAADITLIGVLNAVTGEAALTAADIL